MPLEIERKFLVTGSSWKTGTPIRICQGFLNRDPDRTVRVRIANEVAFLTIKGRTKGAVREEYEYAVPVEHAERMLLLCEGPLIEKRRWLIPMDGFTWEVDEFLGENAGLIVAEIELEDQAATFPMPAWLGDEVTHDPRYFNSSLSKHPFSEW